MRRAFAAAVVAVLALTGCGSDDTGGDAAETPSPDQTVSATPSPTPTDESSKDPSQEPTAEPSADDDAVEIEIEGEKISPNGRRIEVGTGETVTLEIESDRRGELHVHSTPEQEIAFDSGESNHRLTIDTPGVVDVEEHESGIVILQLQVS
jgi:hypothetical protein